MICVHCREPMPDAPPGAARRACSGIVTVFCTTAVHLYPLGGSVKTLCGLQAGAPGSTSLAPVNCHRCLSLHADLITAPSREDDIRAAEREELEALRVYHQSGASHGGGRVFSAQKALKALLSPLPSRYELHTIGKCHTRGQHRGEVWGAYWLRYAAKRRRMFLGSEGGLDRSVQEYEAAADELEARK